MKCALEIPSEEVEPIATKSELVHSKAFKIPLKDQQVFRSFSLKMMFKLLFNL